MYGPSLPYLLTPDELPLVVRKDPNNPKAILPLEATVKRNPGDSNAMTGSTESGVIKFLSFGHVNPKAGVIGAVSCLTQLDICDWREIFNVLMLYDLM